MKQMILKLSLVFACFFLQAQTNDHTGSENASESSGSSEEDMEEEFGLDDLGEDSSDRDRGYTLKITITLGSSEENTEPKKDGDKPAEDDGVLHGGKEGNPRLTDPNRKEGNDPSQVSVNNPTEFDRATKDKAKDQAEKFKKIAENLSQTDLQDPLSKEGKDSHDGFVADLVDKFAGGETPVEQNSGELNAVDQEKINSVKEYRDYVTDQLANLSPIDAANGVALVGVADLQTSYAEKNFSMGYADIGDLLVASALETLDAALGFVPYFGSAADLTKLAIGTDIHGEPLSDFEKAVLLGGAMIPGILKKAGRAIGEVYDSFKDLAKFLADMFSSDTVKDQAENFIKILRKSDAEIAGANHGEFAGEHTANAVGTGILDEISAGKFAEILSMPKGTRPDPGTYLTPDFVGDHLDKFSDGASYLVPKETLDQFGRTLLGRPDNAQFVSPKSDIDDILSNAEGDISKIEEALGIKPGEWAGKELVRIDIEDPDSLNLRMASGNEQGANPDWVPGGSTIGGVNEAVVDQIPQGSYTETDL